jgi:Xaa-Pro aminopeptidase
VPHGEAEILISCLWDLGTVVKFECKSGEAMSIETPEELAGLRAAGNVVSLMLESMKQAVEVGVTTAELDEVGASVMRQHS